MDERDDAAVVARCLEGDRNAYEEIVKRYQRTLFNVALRVLGNYEDARDATQTALVKAYSIWTDSIATSGFSTGFIGFSRTSA